MIIQEFLPNPVGNDKESEYIKIFNNGDNVVLLDGWSVKNIAGKSYKLSGKINADEELILPYSKTKIPLSNNGETIFLYNEKSVLVDRLGYAGGAGLKVGERVIKRPTANESINNDQLLNYSSANYLITDKFLFIDFLTAAILAGLGLYIILQLEKKLDIKLF